MVAFPLAQPEKLAYTIHSSSGYTSTYSPSHILVDSPLDQSSRWTGATNSSSTSTSASAPTTLRTHDDDASGGRRSPSSGGSNGASGSGVAGAGSGGRAGKNETQFVTIKLEHPAVVQSIGFGKFHKNHPCNLKEFVVYGGMSPNPRYMEQLFSGGLKNDTTKETFPLAIFDKTRGEAPAEEGVENGAGKSGDHLILPVQYIRIEALVSWGQNYNVSIWHVWLEGCSDLKVTKPIVDAYEAHRTLQTSHLLLAHLRRSFLLPAFSTLLTTLPSSISSTFEHRLLSALHTSLVLRGSFAGPLGAEEILEECLAQGLFREWGKGGRKGRSVARWEKIQTSLGGREGPGPRAGHQMVRVGRKILLYGGWDGSNDLGDLWEFELPRSAEDPLEGGWRCLDDGEEAEEEEERPTKERSRPTRRSCHQLAVDSSEGWVYLLGSKGPPEDDEEDEEEVVGARTSGGAVPIPIPTASGGNRMDRLLNGAGATNGAGGRGGATNGLGVGGADLASMEVEDDAAAADDEEHEGSNAGEGRRRERRNPYANDFWRYKAVGPGQGKWELLSEDVGVQGGPRLLFDHQMVIDNDARLLYVFGGKHVESPPGDSADSGFSGMYAYHLEEKRWFYLFGDPPATDHYRSERLLSRIGHAMIFDSTLSSLFILAGQRGDIYLSDLWSVKLASSDVPIASGDTSHPPSITTPSTSDLWLGGGVINPTSSRPIVLNTKLVSADYSRDGGPSAAFTQRATIEPETGEWTMMGGLMIEATEELPGNAVWTRSREGVWEKVEVRGEVPPGRYASQLVYDPLRKEHFMFGGHPQDFSDPLRRLDDFWRLRVVKPSPAEALRMAKFLIRKQRFNEMCKTQPTLTALTYLQTTLSAVVDHTDEAEASAFRACMSALLSAPPANNIDDPMDGSSSTSSNSSESAPSPPPAATVSTTTSTGMGSSITSLSQSQRMAQTVLEEEEEEAGKGSALTREVFQERHALFEVLLDFFPDGERQPRDDLREMAAPKWGKRLKGRFD